MALGCAGAISGCFSLRIYLTVFPDESSLIFSFKDRRPACVLFACRRMTLPSIISLENVRAHYFSCEHPSESVRDLGFN